MSGRGRLGLGLKIEPFKHPITMDPEYADKTWKILEDAIREIHNQNASGLSFEELYRNAYNMVLHKHGDRLYAGVRQALARQLQGVARRLLTQSPAGAEPFLRELRRAWDDHVKSTQMVRDILMYLDRTYVAQQRRTPVFQLGLDLWRDGVARHPQLRERLLSSLSDLVARERSGELIDRPLVRAATQMLVDLGHGVYTEDWERPFLQQAHEHYQREAQALLLAPGGGADCPSYLRKAERRLQEERERVAAYLDPSTEPRLTRVVERCLIGDHCKSLAEMEGSGLVALLKQDRHDDLARMYALFRRVDGGLALMRSGMAAHVKEVGEALTADQGLMREPVAYVQRLVEARDKYDAAVQRAFGGDRQFRNALNGAFEAFLNANPRAPEYLSLYVDDRLRRGNRAASGGVSASGGVAALSGAAAASGAEGDAMLVDSASAAAALAADPSAAHTADVEQALDKAMALFRYLQDKDVFEKYYKQHLAKRLLGGGGGGSGGRGGGGGGGGSGNGGNGGGADDEAERGMLVRLKTECGYQFTSRLESMFTDVRTSRDTTAAFREAMAAQQAGGGAGGGEGAAAAGGSSGPGQLGPPLGLELTVQVLTTGSWPASMGGGGGGVIAGGGGGDGGGGGGAGAAPPSSSAAAQQNQHPPGSHVVILPPEMQRCCDAFRTFYLAAHSGRRLAWQPAMGTADLKACGFDGGKRHELTVSTYQAVVLMLFNDADTLTYREIADATGIPPQDLKRCLQSLACVKGKNVLRKTPAGRDVDEARDTFSFNAAFSSKLFKVRIGTVSAAREGEVEHVDTRQRVEDDRKPMIDACLVRIMKSRREVDHNTLVGEVTRQLSARFLLNPLVLKQRIESLIEREFLARDESDRKKYRYVA